MQLTRDGKASGYSIEGGLLFKEVEGEPKLVVPKAMQSTVIKRAHKRGHFSVAKTEAIIRRDFYIQKLRQRIEKFNLNCLDCILANKRQGKQEGFLHSIDKGDLPLDTYHVDHLGPLASTKKSYCHIFAVVDSFSKFVWLYATRSTSSAGVLTSTCKSTPTTGRYIWQSAKNHLGSRHGVYIRRLQTILQRRKYPTYTDHDGYTTRQIERVNRTLIPLLTKLAAPKAGE